MNQSQNTANATVITRRIGSTTYKLKIYFNENAKETMEDKILRMIQNGAVDKRPRKAKTDTHFERICL